MTLPKSANIGVPEQVAVLLRPILSELQHYRTEGGGDRGLVDEYFYAVTKKQGHFADEALSFGGSNDLNGIKTKEVIVHVMKVVF